MNRNLPLLIVVFSLVLPAASRADFVVDQKRSTLEFTVSATGHRIEGHVISFQADLSFPYTGEFPQTATVTFQADRLTTQHEERDREMLKWLEVEKYPEVVFQLEQIEGSGSTRVASGTLTLHGVSRGVIIPLTMTSVGPVVTLTGETEIDTGDFRLPRIRRALVMSVSPMVEIAFELVGRLE